MNTIDKETGKIIKYGMEKEAINPFNQGLKIINDFDKRRSVIIWNN